MSKPNFRPKDLPDTLRVFLSSTVKLAEKLKMLDQDDPVLKLVGAILKGTDMIHDPETAAKRGIGSAVALAFYGGLVKYKVPMYLNDQQERELRAAVKEGIDKAPCKLSELNLSNVFKSETAQHFIKIHFRYFRLSRVDDGREVDQQYEPHLRHYLERWLKVYFLRLLDDQSNKYGVLRDTFEQESFLADREEVKLAQYQQLLAEMYHDPTPFSEGEIKLSDLYIEQNCGVLEKICKDDVFTRGIGGKPTFVQCEKIGLPTSLHVLTMDWLEEKLDHKGLIFGKSHLLLLYGMPGQGKSSFCKRLLHDLLEEDHLTTRPVYFLRLRDPFLDTSRLKSAPLPAIAEAISKRYELAVAADSFDTSILILDGMDELAMGHGMSMSEADDLVRILQETSRRRPNLHVILTSRHGYLRTDRDLENSLVLELDVLTHEQQRIWLKKYHQLRPETVLTSKKLSEIQAQDEAKLGELISQPLLLNLVADLEKIPEATANRAKVYEKLFDHMVSAPWKTEQLEKLNSLSRKNMRNLFRASLREIGFKMFVHGTEYLSEEELLATGSFTRRFLNKLNAEGAEDGIKTIFISFYFKPVSPESGVVSGKNAIEFYHKSFQEFMAAEYLYHNCKRLFLKKGEYDDYELSDHTAALHEWTRLFGQRALSKEIRDYLIEIITNDEDENGRGELKQQLLHFAPVFFVRGFLDSLETGGLAVNKRASVLERTLEAGYAWFLLTGHLDDLAVIPKGEYGWKTSTYYYLRQLATTIRIWRLPKADLREADLRGADLRGAELRGADLRGADLRGADLRGAELRGAELRGAELRGADLTGAELTRAELRGADLTGAELTRAELRDADLTGADLRGAYLRGAYLTGADLTRANLTGADLRGAYLRGAYLRGAYLTGADLTGADLTGADLTRANLRGADLTGADLTTCKSLYNTQNLPQEIESKLRQEKPALFENPFKSEEE